MKSNNGFIYIRHHIYFTNDNICKLGRTKDIYNRDNNYATNEYIRGNFILVIEILDNQIYDDIYVEKLLQKYFKCYNNKKDGGIEFYNIKIIDEIIPFLSKTNIKFKILSNQEINNIIKLGKIIKLQYLLKNF
jgi:hypothetical protein